jgi:hypothetical protein
MENSDEPARAGARFVSGFFKVLAILVVIGGVISAVSVDQRSSDSFASSGNTDGAVFGIIIGSVVASCAILFFAYVLDLLMGIESQTFRSRSHGPAMTLPGAATPSANVNASTAAAGWYPDPHGVTRARFWDGQLWTDQTQE